jgi:ABC-type branched-subunit amino acid transport system ATPase component/Ser-tRNA(Ala) deacylase AlaX
MLKVEHITAGYGKKQVLTDVSFTVERGDMVLLSGGNGSGKSTVLKCVYGLLKPWNETGKVIFEGEDITGLHASEMIRKGIVYMPQKKNVFDEFTVEENLWTSADIYSKSEAKERIKKVFELLPLLEIMRKRTPFHMSGGEKQLLAFGNVLVHSPKLILLDEPFAGVDAENSEILRNCIADLNEKGITFIIVEHKRQLIDSIINKVIELELGTVLSNHTDEKRSNNLIPCDETVIKKFWDDPYLTKLETIVTSVDGDKITLKETIAYAFSGGQQSDSGFINEYEIKAANKINNEIFYTIDSTHNLKTGDKAIVSIDWEKRYKIMRLHFAAEIVLELINQNFENPTKFGANITDKKARLDFIWENNISEIFPFLYAEVEKLINADLPIISDFQDSENEIRHWEIIGFGKVNCGGIHIKSTKEVGSITLKRVTQGKCKERIEIYLND